MALLFTMNLLIAKFTLANKEYGLTHVVDMEERKALCGLTQRIGSTVRSMGVVGEGSEIQCNKCRKTFRTFYSAHTGS